MEQGEPGAVRLPAFLAAGIPRMWCPACQLDVPALAVPEEPGVIRCAFCGAELGGRREGSEPTAAVQGAECKVQSDESVPPVEQEAEISVPTLAFVPPPAIDEWESDAELRRVQRLVAVLRNTHGHRELSRAGVQGAESRMPNDRGSALGTLQPALQSPTAARTADAASLAAWACLTLGLMAFVCGGVLVGWSFVADRGDLWSLGLPLTLGGQVGLVLGLLLQLDGLSQSTQRTAQTLTDLDGRLGELREVTALVSSTHSAPAHSFYAHMSEGASPQILLADLKGQLDLLAQQMARQRKAA